MQTVASPGKRRHPRPTAAPARSPAAQQVSNTPPRTLWHPCSRRQAADREAHRPVRRRPPRRRACRGARESSSRRLCDGQVRDRGGGSGGSRISAMEGCRAVHLRTAPRCSLPLTAAALLALLGACCRAERGSGSFWSGFVLGGVVCGALGFVFAPQVCLPGRLRGPAYCSQHLHPTPARPSEPHHPRPLPPALPHCRRSPRPCWATTTASSCAGTRRPMAR